MKNKIYASFEEAIKDINDGATIMMHGLAGSGGVPQNLIVALHDRGVKNLTIIDGNLALGPAIAERPDGYGRFVTSSLIIGAGQVKKVVAYWVRGWTRPLSAASKLFHDLSAAADMPITKAIQKGEVEWEPISQGVLALALWAGAARLGGIYIPVGIGTILEKGKEKRVIDGKEYLLQRPLRADFAFVRAYKADKFGNLIYRGTSRTYNPLYAMAADVTIAEVDKIVELGEIDPEHVVTPGVFVDRIVEIPEGGWK